VFVHSSSPGLRFVQRFEPEITAHVARGIAVLAISTIERWSTAITFQGSYLNFLTRISFNGENSLRETSALSQIGIGLSSGTLLVAIALPAVSCRNTSGLKLQVLQYTAAHRTVSHLPYLFISPTHTLPGTRATLVQRMSLHLFRAVV
jgi:hypothetical protein